MFAGLAFYASERDLIGLYYEYESSEQQLVILSEDIARLEQEKVRLDHKIVGLGFDPLIVETAVRKNTGQVREGETIYRVEIPVSD
jgi:cell division protein FtsB